MNNIFIGIGAWIKTHIVATAVISTVVVGGAVATPIIVNNINADKPKQDEVQKNQTEDNKEQEVITCDDGYELIDNVCVEIEKEQDVEQEDNKIEETPTTKPNNNSNAVKPSTGNKPSINNSNNNSNNNNNNSNNENKQEQPKEQGLTIKNHGVYYNGVALFTTKNIPTVYHLSENIVTVSYDSNAINSLSKEIRNDIVDNYLCSAIYQGCAYSNVHNRQVPVAIKDTNNYNYEAYMIETNDIKVRVPSEIKRAEDCRDMMKNGTYTYTDYSDDYCSAIDGYTAETWDKSAAKWKNWGENAKTDRDRYQKSYDDFKALWNLLTK